MTSMSVEAFRACFPATAELTYMDVAARGVLPRQTREALGEYLDMRMQSGGDKPAMFERVEALRAGYAALIGAGGDEIAYVKNVSEGLNAIIAAYDWQPGDRVVLCPQLEHPNNIYPWRHLARRREVSLSTVAARDGALDIDAIIDAIDDRTRMVTVSSVTFAPGLVADLRHIGAECRARDVLLLVDGVQSVGLLDTDVESMQVDALSVSTQKGLLGLYGLGLLYCRKAWAQRLQPAYLARFSVDLGQAHEAQDGGADFELMPGARRFEIGNYNYAGVVAAQTSLALLRSVGMARVESHVRDLGRALAEGLEGLGMPLIGPAGGPLRGSIVCIGRLDAGQHDGVDDARLQSLYEHLQAHAVRLSIRRGMLRFSLHAYNDMSDVARVLELVESWQRRSPG
ncbi:MAG: aminotransferase class V-fold PLP-dependent enzyme [Gammaproteobacteria bacterium]|nr:aminotransferase class V-fold PLP-dependent enzyme [Gammaproteobacteria bacterium]